MKVFPHQNLVPKDTSSSIPLMQPTSILDLGDDEALLDDFGLYLKRWGEPSRLTLGINAMKSGVESLRDQTLTLMLEMQRMTQRRLRRVWSQARGMKFR